MRILSFHLKGKMAHFRRYYSNSSALSYSIPPRTTIVGIIAGLLGLKRDSYYEQFSTDKFKVAVGINSPIKKQVHTLNLLMVKNNNDLNASKEHYSQTATEMIMPQNIRSGFVDYRLWVTHSDPEIMDKLAALCCEEGYYTQGISLALGTAQHLGWMEGCELIEGEEHEEDETTLQSIIPVNQIRKLQFHNSEQDIRLLKEDIPFAFNTERKLEKKGDMIINTVPSSVSAEVYKFVKLENGESVTWME